MDIATACSRFRDLAESSAPAAPDQRRQLFDAVIRPHVAATPTGLTDDVLDTLVVACHDPWSAIRKSAAAVAAPIAASAFEKDGQAPAFAQAIIEPAFSFAESTEDGASATLKQQQQQRWFQAHGAVAFAAALHGVSPAAVTEHPSWLTGAVLPASTHPQLPVREVAVALVAKCVPAKETHETTAAVIAAVRKWLAVEVSPQTSPAVQGALSHGEADNSDRAQSTRAPSFEKEVKHRDRKSIGKK